MEFRVFVSYSTLDLAHVELLRLQLSNTPLKLFIAEHSVAPSESLSEKIKSAISSCDLFIVVWSKNAKESGWVSQEIGQAIAQKKCILPLVLDEEHPPSGFVSNLKYIPVFENLPLALEKAKEIAINAYNEKLKITQQLQQKKKDSDAMVVVGLGALFLWAMSK